MNNSITENNENVREVNVDKLLEEVLLYEKGESPKSAFEMRNVYNFPLKKKGERNTFSQKPKRNGPPPKTFGKLPNMTRKQGGRTRKTLSNKRRLNRTRARARKQRRL